MKIYIYPGDTYPDQLKGERLHGYYYQTTITKAHYIQS